MPGAVLTMGALHARFQKRALLGVLVGNLEGVRALCLAREVLERFPAVFPEFAAELVEGDTRAACWDLAEIARDLVGAFNVYHEAAAIAAGRPTPWFVSGPLRADPAATDQT